MTVRTDCQDTVCVNVTYTVGDTPGTLGLRVELLDASRKATRGISPVAEDSLRKWAPVQCCFPGDLPTGAGDFRNLFFESTELNTYHNGVYSLTGS